MRNHGFFFILHMLLIMIQWGELKKELRRKVVWNDK